MFRISKIQFFESNSQPGEWVCDTTTCCSEYQRYNFLKAIHNRCLHDWTGQRVVQNIKDTIFWKQFTTKASVTPKLYLVVQNIKDTIFWKQFTTFGISFNWYSSVVQNIKDTIFWKQFTTPKEWVKEHPLVVQNIKDTIFWKQFTTVNTWDASGKKVVQNIKDTIFWKQFTTRCLSHCAQFWVVQNIKDTIFWKQFTTRCTDIITLSKVVQNIKDTIFWKQFTTFYLLLRERYKVVQNIKDTIFWKQFTTDTVYYTNIKWLFRISKIQFFESNSQRLIDSFAVNIRCSEYQRYNFLKAIHNDWRVFFHHSELFRISKIQFFESNSQLTWLHIDCYDSCSEYQRYNFLKAIHNLSQLKQNLLLVVQNIKDTIFWKQFTTCRNWNKICCWLFRISKIQFFESNSQLWKIFGKYVPGCSEYQRYNFLKAIHNATQATQTSERLFRISKIQFFESNSQL